MKVQVNIVELATVLAEKKLERFQKDALTGFLEVLPLPNGIYVKESSGNTKYTKEAQVLFDQCYDEYFSIISVSDLSERECPVCDCNDLDITSDPHYSTISCKNCHYHYYEDNIEEIYTYPEYQNKINLHQSKDKLLLFVTKQLDKEKRPVFVDENEEHYVIINDKLRPLTIGGEPFLPIEDDFEIITVEKAEEHYNNYKERYNDKAVSIGFESTIRMYQNHYPNYYTVLHNNSKTK